MQIAVSKQIVFFIFFDGVTIPSKKRLASMVILCLIAHAIQIVTIFIFEDVPYKKGLNVKK